MVSSIPCLDNKYMHYFIIYICLLLPHITLQYPVELDTPHSQTVSDISKQINRVTIQMNITLMCDVFA